MSDGPGTFIPIAAPDIGSEEEAAVLRVLRSGRLAQGPEVRALEEAFALVSGARYAVAVANGTAALHAALQALGIGPGDEVLVPAFTFAATANAVLATGAVPIFIDIDADFLMDLSDAAAKITPNTAAMMPVHLYGLMADMHAVHTFASLHGLAIVEDAAQAHLARRAGVTPGQMGVAAYSLYATKNMMSGEGGLVTTSSSEIAERVRLFRNHGMSDRYHHETWGMNLRMTDLQAAMGRVQLDKLPEATRRRIENAAALTDGLPSLFTTPRVPADAYHVFHQFTVRVPAPYRDRVVEEFKRRQIGVDIYYPLPLTRQPSLKKWSSECPSADAASGEVISLPVHPKVDAESLDRVIEAAIAISAEMS
ncbi:MAG: aminotransferase class I/II-fold pyridoxal phosphate-dependent enzyme [Gammaproteobacteria bacterium]|nr:aminotransferase class I/II-fold pyridoxal phosphate-dependent enzyme [Gammaproteobacteria bacterium]